MRVPDFALDQPRSLDEAFAAVRAAQAGVGAPSRPGSAGAGAGGDAAPAGGTPWQAFDFLGGGTDLLCNYKWRLNVRPRVVSLRHLPELRAEAGGPLAAGRTLYEIEHCPVVRERWPELARAAAQIATPLIRRSGTLGGNLHLDTRCWHFNQTAEWRQAHRSCLKAEADACRVQPVPGDVCVATYSGDLAPVLLAYGASAVLAGPDGTRTVPLADYFAADGIRRFADRKPDEIVLRVEMPEQAEAWTVRYQKLRLRDTFDFPEGGVAVGVRWADRPGGEVAEARVATTAYDSVPRLHPDQAAELVGRSPDAALAEEVGASLAAEVRPMKNTSMAPSYRKKMARVLCKRAVLACLPDSDA